VQSITNRLALLFFAITLAAIGGLYIGVISGLDRGVREKKLDTLDVLARQYSGPIRTALDASLDRRVLDARVRRAADASGARVTLLGVNEGTQGQQGLEPRDPAAGDEHAVEALAVAMCALDDGANDGAAQDDEGDRADEEDGQCGARVEDVRTSGTNPKQHAGENDRGHDRADGD